MALSWPKTGHISQQITDSYQDKSLYLTARP
jgi:hypothetical protein